MSFFKPRYVGLYIFFYWKCQVVSHKESYPCILKEIYILFSFSFFFKFSCIERCCYNKLIPNFTCIIKRGNIKLGEPIFKLDFLSETCASSCALSNSLENTVFDRVHGIFLESQFFYEIFLWLLQYI